MLKMTCNMTNAPFSYPSSFKAEDNVSRGLLMETPSRACEHRQIHIGT